MINTKRAPNAHERADVPTIAAAGGGSLGQLCNTLRKGERLTIDITRSDDWQVVVTLPDGRSYDAAANSVPNALWEVIRDA